MFQNRTLILVPLALLLAGCAEIDMPFRAPQTALPDRYSIVAPVQAPSRTDTEWWRHFRDPVLDQLVDEGLRSNLSIAQAQARLREAYAEARRAKVPVTGNATVDLRGSDPGDEQAQIGASADINLAGQGRFRASAAGARLQASQFDTIEARRTVLSEIARSYADLRFYQASRAFRAQDLTSRQRTLRDIRTQVESGAATKLDLLRAQALLAETKSQIPQLDASIVQSRNRLSTLLGVPVGMLAVDLGYRGAQPAPHNMTEVGVPADLLRARPDIRRAERLYAAAVSDVGVADAARYPSLRLSGVITAPLDSGSDVTSLVAGLVLPVFNQSALAADAEGARARVEQAYLQWRVAVLAAVEEVENAQVQLRAATASVAAAREAVNLNRQSLALSRELVTSGGDITVLDVLDRERALSDSRSSLAQGLRDVARAYIALRVALGRGHPLLVQDKASKSKVDDGVGEATVTRTRIAADFTTPD